MKFLVIQHRLVEHFGSFASFCQSAGIEVEVVEIERGEQFPTDLSSYDAVWVLGGPMNVDQEEQYPWLRAEKALIRQAVLEAGLPFCGICLGAQLLADALGGRVGPMAAPEVGVWPITLNATGQENLLLKGLPLTLPVLHWHGYEVKRLPPGGQVLAASTLCRVQAFVVNHLALGLQFHPEVTTGVMESWLSQSEYRVDLQAALGPTGCEDLQAAVTAHQPIFEANARVLFDNFLTLVRQRQAQAR